MSFFQELKRRNVLRAAGAYVAVSWLILQVAETLLPAFDLEDAVLRTILIVLAIGFIPAVAAAWAFELTPGGLVRDAEVDRTSPEGRRLDKRLDRLLVVALALAVAYFAVDKFVLDPARDRDREAAVADAAAEVARAEAVSSQRAGPSTLAVLPFTAVGGTEDSRFFAAGVHDDLLTRLAKLDFLRVISRTSVMKYQDTTLSIPAIGEALGADTILEGGVQSAGNRIRINAQLIDADTDEHLWAETYDRELTTASIFDVQADISRAIARALQAAIDEGSAEEERLVPTDNMAAYRAFHESQAMRREFDRAVLTPEYQNLLRRALELDPNFARAAAELVGALSFYLFGGEPDPAALEEAESLLARLRAVAPDSAEHLMAQAYYTYYVLKDYDLAGDIITRAQKKAPSDLQLLSLKSWIQRRQGDVEGKLETNRLQRTLDPEDPRYLYTIVGALYWQHRYDEALAELRSASQLDEGSMYLLADLRVMEHGDLKQRADDHASVYETFGDPPPETVAESYIEARAYDAAFEWLNGVDTPYAPAELSHVAISSIDLPTLEAHWLRGDREAVDAMLPRVKATHETHRKDHKGVAVLGDALLAIVSGKAEEAERDVARWLRESREDLAARGGDFNHACRLLGMAGAAGAAVDCLRQAFDEPSRAAPFIEPYVPHYDAVRDSPEFRALLEDLETPR